MATGFKTKNGQIITGKFGEALAKANPSQGMSVSDSPSEVIKRVSSRGGRGSSSRSRNAPVGPSRADLEAEQQRQAEAERQAEAQRQQQEKYDASKDMVGPQPLTEQQRLDVIRREQTQRQLRTDVARPPTRQEIESAKRFDRREGFNQPSPSELKTAGYTRLNKFRGNAVPTFGTAIIDPSTGLPETTEPSPNFEDVEYISPDGKLSKVKDLTKFEVRKTGVESEREKVTEVIDPFISEGGAEFQKRDNKLYEKYQAEADKTGDVSEAQKKYEEERLKVFDEVNEQTLKKIQESPEVLSAQKRYETKATKLGASQGIFGEKDISFPELEERKVKFKDKSIREKATDVLSFVPGTGQVITMGKTAKELQQTPGYFTGHPFVKTTYSKDITPEDLKSVESTDIPVSSQLSFLAAGGFTILQASSILSASTKAVNEEKALKVLNKKISSGNLKLTKKQLETGVFNIKIKDEAGKTITQRLSISKAELNKVANQINIRKQYLRNLGLKDYEKIDIKLAGGSTEKKLFKQAFSSELDDTFVSSAEIGKFTGVTKRGKVDTGFILQTTTQKGDKGFGVSYIIKTTKTGKIKSTRVVKTKLESGVKELYRPAFPSELKSFDIPIEGQPSVKVSEIERLRPLKVFKEVANVENRQKEIADNLLVISKKQSKVFEVATPVGSKTTSVGELFGPQMSPIIKTKKPILVSSGKSFRIEAFTSPKDILLSSSDDAGDISVKVATQRIGRSLEFGRTTTIPKPVKFDVVDKQIPKIVSGFDDVSSTLIKKDTLGGTEQIKKAVNKLSTDATSDVAIALKSYNRVPSVGSITEVKNKINLDSLQGSIIGTTNVLPSIKEKDSFSSSVAGMNIKSQEASKKINLRKIANTQKQITKPISKTINALSPAIISSTAVAPRLNFDSKQIPSLKKIVPAINISPTQFRFRFPRTPDIGGGIGVGFPSFNRGKQRPQGTQTTRKRMAKSLKATRQYSSSLLAAAFQSKPTKVTRKQYEKLKRKVYTGAEVRPVLQIVDDGDDFQAEIKKALSI